MTPRQKEIIDKFNVDWYKGASGSYYLFMTTREFKGSFIMIMLDGRGFLMKNSRDNQKVYLPKQDLIKKISQYILLRKFE